MNLNFYKIFVSNVFLEFPGLPDVYAKKLRRLPPFRQSPIGICDTPIAAWFLWYFAFVQDAEKCELIEHPNCSFTWFRNKIFNIWKFNLNLTNNKTPQLTFINCDQFYGRLLQHESEFSTTVTQWEWVVMILRKPRKKIRKRRNSNLGSYFRLRKLQHDLQNVLLNPLIQPLLGRQLNKNVRLLGPRMTRERPPCLLGVIGDKQHSAIWKIRQFESGRARVRCLLEEFDAIRIVIGNL